jgi:hypothetical protein
MKIHKKAGGDAKRDAKAGGGGGDFEDEELECRDCNAKFTFTVGEQEFYAQKGFDNKPVRGLIQLSDLHALRIRLGCARWAKGDELQYQS